jgi:hypothetical protein
MPLFVSENERVGLRLAIALFVKPSKDLLLNIMKIIVLRRTEVVCAKWKSFSNMYLMMVQKKLLENVLYKLVSVKFIPEGKEAK